MKKECSVKKVVNDIASCGLCGVRNYESQFEQDNKVVDEIYLFRIGNVVHSLCKGCLKGVSNILLKAVEEEEQ